MLLREKTIDCIFKIQSNMSLLLGIFNYKTE